MVSSTSRGSRGFGLSRGGGQEGGGCLKYCQALAEGIKPCQGRPCSAGDACGRPVLASRLLQAPAATDMFSAPHSNPADQHCQVSSLFTFFLGRCGSCGEAIAASFFRVDGELRLPWLRVLGPRIARRIPTHSAAFFLLQKIMCRCPGCHGKTPAKVAEAPKAANARCPPPVA